MRRAEKGEVASILAVMPTVRIHATLTGKQVPLEPIAAAHGQGDFTERPFVGHVDAVDVEAPALHQADETLKRYGVPLKIVLIDNSSLGLVRQWQELFFAENYSEIDLSDNPDFVKVAEAFGIEAFRIDRRDQVSEGIQRLLAADGPCLAHVVIDPRDNVWPLVPPGKSNAEMMEGS